MEEIERLNWESREREYKEKEERVVSVRRLLEDGFAREVWMREGGSGILEYHSNHVEC